MSIPNSDFKENLWLWSHEAGSHNGKGIPADSNINPIDAAKFMGLQNVIMVRYGGKPEPSDFKQHMEYLKDAGKLVWSVVGDTSTKQINVRDDLNVVLNLTEKYQNICGVMMDDFFPAPGKSAEDSRISVDEVRHIQEKLDSKDMDIWVVIYDNQLDIDISSYLPYCDVLNLWTWNAKDLCYLDRNISRLKKIAGDKKIALGCYMWDYSCGAPVPANLMEQQLSAILKYYESGDISSAVFLGSCICDLNIDAVVRTKNWISSL